MLRLILIPAIAMLTASLRAEIEVRFDHNSPASASSSWKFPHIPSPAKNDAAATAKVTTVDGARDPNGAEPARLQDGRVATEEDQPSANFFFRQGADGGRIVMDLGKKITIKQVNSYSWHSDTRAPQVYRLYGSTGDSDKFNAEPKRDTDPASCGWTSLASVDTRPKDGSQGGQFGVSIGDTSGSIGEYRYLLFDIRKTEDRDPFGNTFYSEIDVIDANAPAPDPVDIARNETITRTFDAADGKYQIVLDTSAAPDLTDWAYKELAPVAVEWYPKLVDMLPSEGYEAPKRVTLAFKDNMGGTPAAAGGSRISLNTGWYRRNLKGEAKGAAIHELVHVVQQYGRARRTNPNATRGPGWLTEGIPDYIRWFKYEPETHGAEITRRNIERAKYDASYRVTGNFLNWVTEKYNPNLVQNLNAALREGKYKEDLWQSLTKHTVQELGDEWKREMAARIEKQASTTPKP